MIKLIDMEKLNKKLLVSTHDGYSATEVLSMVSDCTSEHDVDGSVVSLTDGMVIREGDKSIDWPSISRLELNEFRPVERYQIGDEVDKKTWLPVFRPVKGYFK
jgi:hypothetical protein